MSRKRELMRTRRRDNQPVGRIAMKRCGKAIEGNHYLDIERQHLHNADHGGVSNPDVEGRFSDNRPLACSICVSHRLTAATRSAPRGASRSSAPAPPWGVARSRAATTATHACRAEPSLGRLEILRRENRLARLRQETARSAKTLPRLARGLSGGRRRREPGDHPTSPLDVDRLASCLDLADELQAARAKLRHRDVHEQILHGHFRPFKRIGPRFPSTLPEPATAIRQRPAAHRRLRRRSPREPLPRCPWSHLAHGLDDRPARAVWAPASAFAQVPSGPSCGSRLPSARWPASGPRPRTGATPPPHRRHRPCPRPARLDGPDPPSPGPCPSTPSQATFPIAPCPHVHHRCAKRFVQRAFGSSGGVALGSTRANGYLLGWFLQRRF